MPKLLDLFCGQGGAGMGYHRAGFEVVGVDIADQRRYPFTFVQGDALEYLNEHWREFDVVHASPPCQTYSKAQSLRTRQYRQLVSKTRILLRMLGIPFIIENVPGSRLYDYTELCGSMFGLGVYRHRWFETNFPVGKIAHPAHVAPQNQLGRAVNEGEMMYVVGNFIGVDQAKVAMGIDWMSRPGLREAIPPAYTEWIGRQIP